MNFIFEGYYLQLALLFMFMFVLLIFIRRYLGLSGKNRQPLFWLVSGKDKILILGIAMLVVAVFGYLVELYLLGKTVFFLSTNPLLLIILRVDSAEQAALLEQAVSGLMKGSGLMMTTLIVFLFSALFWYILDSKIKKVKEVIELP